MEIRTRFAPSPTGYMHIGNLRTALYEYLIAKSQGGKFILRIEDTDQGRLVEGATDIIYNTLKMTGLHHDEGPDVGGAFGPYIQSERMGMYMDYAKELVEKGEAYYCFCTKERLEALKENNGEGAAFAKYDRHCFHLTKEEVQGKLDAGEPFVIRQKMPEEGTTTFHDMVYGEITVENKELDDQILMKADGFPTYNFANVVDDHLMKITHVVRGSEYLSSTPKYNLLYQAFGWDAPVYVHLPAVMRDAHHKLSKRHGDKSFEDLVREGYLVEAIVNYIALLGWSPSDNTEIFTLQELEEKFDIAGLSKSPAIFDIKKLTWMNSEYMKAMEFEKFYALAEPKLREALGETQLDGKKIAVLLQKRLETLNDIPALVAFFKELPTYGTELYTHKKMKTDDAIALTSLQAAIPVLKELTEWSETTIHDRLIALVGEMGIKNGQLLWPVRTALSGEPTSPGGAIELADILGKEETLRRLEKGIALLS
ncbi:MAG TPA: glutamate--tRNA ligase [Clostridium sp.]|uniref:Glutamate--tRNA ligase n=1 Tax=Anaerotignum propionicum DSM 1682 TaxID=991789 RepID=A0A110A6P0_ANAPI|nr:glutamate--tRNA ligase [Anaerotignum propionicum]AMJ39791.1 glutamate--tRNA ligase [Anaerotignum propionicum DSM 1682]SHE28511.1 glutamyl-tRNA synthetase [[Clostridium] propionicum DSM 1682] [Anaerotignum propionicum DSM 1682]HBF66572.1 glutamate--tRNA ligase [Clostridium sp.]